MIEDDAIQVFRKMEDLESLAQRLGKVGSPGGRFDVFQICNDGHMPGMTPAWFDAHPITISGAESEGASPTITYNPGQTIPVLVLGGVPSVGDNLPARLISGLWVAEKRGGSGGGGFPDCGCTGIPGTLNVTWVAGPSSTYGDGVSYITRTTTIVYGSIAGFTGWAGCVDISTATALCNGGPGQVCSICLLFSGCQLNQERYPSSTGPNTTCSPALSDASPTPLILGTIPPTTCSPFYWQNGPVNPFDSITITS